MPPASQAGRYEGVPDEHRICVRGDLEVAEGEFHFVSFHCAFFFFLRSDPRKQLLV